MHSIGTALLTVSIVMTSSSLSSASIAAVRTPLTTIDEQVTQQAAVRRNAYGDFDEKISILPTIGAARSMITRLAGKSLPRMGPKNYKIPMNQQHLIPLFRPILHRLRIPRRPVRQPPLSRRSIHDVIDEDDKFGSTPVNSHVIPRIRDQRNRKLSPVPNWPPTAEKAPNGDVKRCKQCGGKWCDGYRQTRRRAATDENLGVLPIRHRFGGITGATRDPEQMDDVLRRFYWNFVIDGDLDYSSDDNDELGRTATQSIVPDVESEVLTQQASQTADTVGYSLSERSTWKLSESPPCGGETFDGIDWSFMPLILRRRSVKDRLSHKRSNFRLSRRKRQVGDGEQKNAIACRLCGKRSASKQSENVTGTGAEYGRSSNVGRVTSSLTLDDESGSKTGGRSLSTVDLSLTEEHEPDVSMDKFYFNFILGDEPEWTETILNNYREMFKRK